MSRSSSGASSQYGLVHLILAVMLVWALLFGVTIDGKHYGVAGCSESGLRFDVGRPVEAADGGAP